MLELFLFFVCAANLVLIIGIYDVIDWYRVRYDMWCVYMTHNYMM